MPDLPVYDDALLGPQRSSFPETRHRFARIVIWPLALLFAAIVFIFYVAFDVTRIEGNSMEPNFFQEDRVLLTKTYPVAHRGDVVIVHTSEQGQLVDLIKRVVAVPGDVVEIRDDQVIVNGAPEHGYRVIRSDELGVDRAPHTVERGEVFLMGDNRPISYDSRYFGVIPRTAIDGRAVFIFAPMGRVGPVPSGPELTAKATGR